MKFSFSVPSKQPCQTFTAGDPNATASDAIEYITEFDSNKSPAKPNTIANLTIPPKANEWMNNQANPNPSPNPDPVLQRLKEDLKKLPEDNGVDDYTDMPVEGYGAALLRGYGWSEGRGIGRNHTEDVKVVEHKQWTGKQGIGFTGQLPNDSIS